MIRIDAGGPWTVTQREPDPDFPGMDVLSLRRIRRGRNTFATTIMSDAEYQEALV